MPAPGHLDASMGEAAFTKLYTDKRTFPELRCLHSFVIGPQVVQSRNAWRDRKRAV
jgi:hypothetical protein